MFGDSAMRVFAENALEMCFAFDRMGKILYMNKQTRDLLSYPEKEGVTIYEIFPQNFEQRDYGFESTFVFGDELQELNCYRQNRTTFRVVARILPYDESKNVYVCFAEDISSIEYLKKEVIRVSKDAEEALKVKSEFVANVTHELRTPVNGILGNTRELVSLEEDREKLRIMSLIERGCADMNQIINNILDFSKLEAGKFTLEPREFEFRTMIDYIKGNHINKITEKGLECFITISPEIPERIIADELRLVQILNNLMSNACKFTTVGKIILEVVKTAQVGNRAELFFMVIDSGIGIDKSQMDKLFKSFSQVDASISRKYGGTGLGLNITKQLVELMGGKVNVDSIPGKGSTFSFSIWVELPASEVAEGEMQADAVMTPAEAIRSLQKELPIDQTKEFGSTDNTEELQKRMSKLILCVEMRNWEKAELFVEAIKQLTDGAPKEIKTAVLRLKMSIQKEDYEKTAIAFESLQEML